MNPVDNAGPVRAPAEQGWYTAGIEVRQPAPARIYDGLTGGLTMLAADRTFCAQLVAAVPGAPMMASANAAFLQWAVTAVVTEAGIRQFVHLGCGVPGPASLHHLLAAVAPQARVVHADIDPVAVQATADAIHTAGLGDRAAAIRADIRRPAAILHHPGSSRLLDLAGPVAIVATNVLHHLPDDEQAQAVLAELRDSCAPGTYLIISHLAPGTAAARYADLHQSAGISITARNRATISRLLTGWDLTSAGVTRAPRWQPYDHEPGVPLRRGTRPGLLAAVARRPGRATPQPRRPA